MLRLSACTIIWNARSCLSRDFNTQLAGFLARATPAITGLWAAPADRIAADKAAMVALPPVVGWRASIRLPRDHYVRLDSNARLPARKSLEGIRVSRCPCQVNLGRGHQ